MSATLRLMAFVKDRPNQWISALEFEQFGRLCWRTEISRARKKFKAANDGAIEWRQRYEHFHAPNCPAILAWDIPGACNCGRHERVTISEYRYVPNPDQPAGDPVPAPQGHDINDWGLR